MQQTPPLICPLYKGSNLIIKMIRQNSSTKPRGLGQSKEWDLKITFEIKAASQILLRQLQNSQSSYCVKIQAGSYFKKTVLNNGIEFCQKFSTGQIYVLTDTWQFFFFLIHPCYHHGKDNQQKALFCIYQSSHVQIHLISWKSFFKAPAL